MAKGAYIGVDGKARKIKKGYIGILTDTSRDVTATITADNISKYFSVENGEYPFVGSGATFTANNGHYTSYIKMTALSSFDVSLDYTLVGFAANGDTFTVNIAGNQVAYFEDGDRYPITKSWSGTLNAGDAIEITLGAGGRIWTGDDLEANFSNMVVSYYVQGSMVEVARKIKKAYIGIGGVARPCFSMEGLEYYGTITPMSTTRSNGSAATVGNYALLGFGTGDEGTYGQSSVDVYDKNFTHSTTKPALGGAKQQAGAATVGKYAIFAGGSKGYNNPTGEVVCINSRLTWQGSVNALSQARLRLAATTVGNYAIFAGGYYSYSRGDVDVYDNNLTKQTLSSIGDRDKMAATTVGNYAIFAGGDDDGTAKNYMYEFDSALTRYTTGYLSEARTMLSATTVGGYALFAGGYNSSAAYSNVVDAFTADLTRTTQTPLSVGRQQLVATTVGKYAVFGGGRASSALTTVDVYDENLTRTTGQDLSIGGQGMMATTIENYALFAGGTNSSSQYSTTVDAYVANT